MGHTYCDLTKKGSYSGTVVVASISFAGHLTDKMSVPQSILFIVQQINKEIRVKDLIVN